MTASPARSRTTRIAGAVAASVGLALVLAGCIKVDADVTIASDAKASGSLSLALQKQAAQMLGMTDLDSFASGIKESDTTGSGGAILSSSDCTPSETDTDFVLSCTFADTTFTGSDDPWQIAKDGNTIVFTMHEDAPSADNSALLGDASLGTMTVNVTFPGDISSITGAEKTSDSTATVTTSMNQALDVKIVSATGGGSSTVIGNIAKLLAVLLAVLVLVLIVVVAIVLIRRRGGSDPADTAPPVVPAPMPDAAPTDSGIPVAEASVTEPAVSEPVATQLPEPSAPPVEPPPAPPVEPPAPEEPTPPAPS